MRRTVSIDHEEETEMSEANNYMRFDDHVVDIMLEVLGVAMRDNFPNCRIDQDDMGYVFDALTVLCHRTPELDIFEGLLHVARQDFIGASHIFQRLVDQRQCLPSSRALLVVCKSMNNDPNWQGEARQVLDEETDEDTVLMVRTVIARNDLLNAIEAAKRSGQFEIPASITALKEERARRQAAQAEGAVPVPTLIDPSMMMGGQYMRL
jgi:type III secretion protein HrpB1